MTPVLRPVSKILRVLLLVLLGSLTKGCEWTVTSPERNLKNYFPLGVGDVWYYVAQDYDSAEVRIDRVNKVGDNEYFGVSSNFPRWHAWIWGETPYFRVDESGDVTFLRSQEVDTLFRLNAEVGDTWWVTPDTTSVGNKARLLSRHDSVTTVFGQYRDCLRFRFGWNDEVYTDMLLAPGIGIVRVAQGCTTCRPRAFIPPPSELKYFSVN